MASELRMVLLGGKRVGKSSSGNTILGREEFDLKTAAAQSVKRQGEVAGRQVTVVDTPGWWRNHPVAWTDELVKQEIVRSVFLCPPGPHTILLVIDVDVVLSEQDRRSVEEHLQLLNERVWSHTIVLFTRGDCLGDKTIEQHIEREGKELQWLVEKCGNRYHVLKNKNRGDDTQVTELLDKVEEMVAGNRGGHYEIDREILDKIEERRRAEEERAQQSLMMEQKETLRSSMVSGDSRAERDDDSSRRAEAGSLQSLEESRDSRSDLLSLGSSGYGSQRSTLSHLSSVSPSEHAQKGSAEEQLRSARLVFVERVTMSVLNDLLDGLLQEKVINDSEMEAVKVEAVRKERARVTIDMVLKKGSLSCSVMKTIWAKYDPALYKTLGFQ